MDNNLYDFTTRELINYIIKVAGMEALLVATMEAVWEEREKGDEPYLIKLQNNLIKTLEVYKGRNNE